MSIVDLGVAARHLSVELDDDGDTIEEMLRRVEGLVLEHLERGPYEDDENIPQGVKQAVLLALTEVYDKRDSDPMTDAVISLLRPFRSPGVW